MTFLDRVMACDRGELAGQLAACTAADVERALAREHRDDRDLVALFSPAADPLLESLARASKRLTERRFGRVIQMYAPLYLSNTCVNRCVYCGFAQGLDIPRATLTVAEALAEARLLHDQGFRHILLVTGEDRKRVTLPYLVEVVQGLRALFHGIGIEIQPLDREEYAALAAAGVDSLTLYQEVYDPERYRTYHPAGPKSRMGSRFEAIEAGGEAGLRTLGIGTLLGLAPWREEAVMVARHGRYLTRRFWRSRIAVSFPRIRGNAGAFDPPHPVGDRDLVHMLLAARLVLPDAELVLSTREPAALRDNLIGLGVTRMSAGSRTNPGGYGAPAEHDGEQFRIDDGRPPEEIARVIAAHDREPVWKDFDREFIPS